MMQLKHLGHCETKDMCLCSATAAVIMVVVRVMVGGLTYQRGNFHACHAVFGKKDCDGKGPRGDMTRYLVHDGYRLSLGGRPRGSKSHGCIVIV